MPGQSAKQTIDFKKSMSSIVGMCSSSGKSGCQMMGFAAKCASAPTPVRSRSQSIAGTVRPGAPVTGTAADKQDPIRVYLN